MTLNGLPMQTIIGGTSLKEALHDPTTVPLPMVTPVPIKQCAATQTSSSMAIFLAKISKDGLVCSRATRQHRDR
jgi:hypothetical protein